MPWQSLGWFVLAAVFEIAGCFSFWAWLRQERSVLWIIPGVLSLLVFALILTRAEPEQAGRAYAAYGGVYVVTAMTWLWIAENARPDKWDLMGAALCLAGTSVILLAPRGS